MAKQRPHPKNVPGPFYIVDGCCLTCLMPHTEAPEMMGFDEDEHHCFVKKQPRTPEELECAIQAVLVTDLPCLRYAGRDPEVLRRLAAVGETEICDHPLPRRGGAA